MTTLTSLRRTAAHLRPQLRQQRTLMAGGSAALFAEVLLRLAEPWPLKVVVDAVAVPAGRSPDPGADPGRTLVLAAVALAAVAALRAGASYLATVAFALAGNRVLTEIRAQVYAHLQRLSLAYHSRQRVGDLVQRLTGDVGRLQEVAVTAALPLVANVATFVGMVLVMAWLDWRLTLLALLAAPMFALSNARLGGRIATVARQQRRREGALASVATESFGAIQLVQAYSLEGALQSRFAASNQRSLKEGVKAKRLAAALERRTDVVIGIATGVVVLAGSRMVLTGSLTPGELVVFVTYLKSAFKPMRDMAKYTGRLAKAAASGERIVEILESDPDIDDAPWARPAPPFRGAVHLDGVTVRYGEGRPALDRVQLRFRPGERVAVVGPSGAGKSTLAALLLRLRDPDEGCVRIDGHDLRALTLRSVRAQLSVVLQDSILFAGSVRDNIAHGAAEPDQVDDDAIEAAARLANAHDFVCALPDGYDSVVGERGTSLSGGERQRIAIARAAIRRARVVVLDEAMAGLDEANAHEVLEALRRLTAGRTTVVIAHDPAEVADADVVVHLDRGRVVALDRRRARRRPLRALPAEVAPC